ncbi:hypothetical protein RD055328_05100 [Companilactobacillus sp. RD055328]|uniref:YneF family protein n=1 Tax=Companilactobacillus sp. RD055328 TaxID=2916634 RepID=UPI001FC80796|nr:YneF family protein [Companilactobacillus sp. RD055328]GKQ42587.1 hypothetical protein RD055328_05100 [Companilactobacillus sp. RD055328]
MNIITIIVGLVALLIGLAGGFFIARWYMKRYFEDNPPINADMMRQMMAQMGQKPSQKKLNQMMTAMKQQNKK